MIPTGPESSLQRWEFYFESEQPTESEQAYLDWTINTLIPEDTALYENVQHGLRSQGYSQGRFVINRNRPEWSEHHVHQFQKLVHDAIRFHGTRCGLWSWRQRFSYGSEVQPVC